MPESFFLVACAPWMLFLRNWSHANRGIANPHSHPSEGAVRWSTFRSLLGETMQRLEQFVVRGVALARY